jgi:hypothetical protein
MFVHVGVVYQVANHNMHYKFNDNDTSFKSGALVDGGANGGLSADVKVIKTSYRRANATGIADQKVHDLLIAMLAGRIQTKSGIIIGLFYQYAHINKGITIHSAHQMQQWGVIVDDNPKSTGDLQQIYTSRKKRTNSVMHGYQ